MRKFKKLSAVLLSVVLLLSCMTITAYAAERETQDGLSAVIETDKESYDANEPILVTVTVTNNNSFAMKNVSIESILPASLTISDGTLKSDTVNLEAGQELTLTFTAVLEKDVPPVTEPGTSEPDTSEPGTSEPDTTDPTVTDPSEPPTSEPDTTEPGTSEPDTTEPVVTEPSTSEPDTTEPAVTNPTTQPTSETPTAAGEVTKTEEQTTLTPEITTAVNAADHVNGTSPITGAPAVALKVLFVVVMVAAVAFAVVMLTRKNGKKATKIISVVLSAAIGISALATTSMIAKAEENTRSFSVDKTITVDGEDYTLEGKVHYDSMDAFELIIDQKDFTTTDNKVKISGKCQSDIDIKDITYSVTSYSDNGEISNQGQASVNNGIWNFTTALKPDWNKITVTAESQTGEIVSKTLTVTYDPGETYVPDKDAICYDEEVSGYYVDNILICYMKTGTSQDDVNKLVDDVSGTIVGQLNALDQYQIKIDHKDFDELKTLCDTIMKKYDFVIYCTYDTAYSESVSYVPEDPWENDVDDDDWNDEDIDGSNWWAEAIEVQKAWDYSERFNKINVGICDSGFDIGHEDLKNQYSFPNEILEKRNTKESHGTHVSGIIGAEANNGKGITGVAWNSHMLFAPYYPNLAYDDVALQWDTSTYANLTYLVEAGAKVVNFSQAKTKYLSSSRPSYSKDFIEREGNLAAIFISKLLDEGYDFLVVQAAGNDGIDALQSGWFCSITSNSITGSNTTTITDVLDRTIVVAAVAETTSHNYQLTDFSNFGNQVSIAAPGENIYSCVPGGILGLEFFGGYKDLSGTSMAAPIVSGVTALVWSINSNFSGSDVKNIVLNSTDNFVEPVNSTDHQTYKMVNANLSVIEAVRRTNGNITGTIKAKGNLSVSEEVAVPDATIEIANALSLPGRPQETRKYTSNENGVFNISIEPGVYDITISKLGYETLKVEDITVTEQKITDLGDIYLKSISEEPSVEPGIPDTAVEFNGHYYQVYDTPMTWNEAKAYCESLGGHLVTITSDTEQEFVETLIANGKKKSYWLGGTDAANEGTWEWITGEKFDYTNWREFMPDNWQNEDYLMMYKEMDPSYTGETFGRWNDLKSDGTCPGNSYFSKDIFGFICEWDTESSQTGTCITQMEITDHDQYTGNQGDSCVFHLDRSGLPGKDNDYYRNGNIGLDGTEYNNGLEVWIARWNFREEISWAYATYKLDGKYTKLIGKTSLIQSANTDNFDTTIYFYDGDKLLQSYTLTNEDYEKQIDVDVTGVNELKILVQDNKAVKRGTSFALYDMFLK